MGEIAPPLVLELDDLVVVDADDDPGLVVAVIVSSDEVASVGVALEDAGVETGVASEVDESCARTVRCTAQNQRINVGRRSIVC